MIPVTVSFVVYDQQELNVVHEATAMIDRYRSALMEQNRQELAQQAPPERPAHPDDVEGKVVGSITPQGATKPEAPKAEPTVPETEMATVVQAALEKLGLADTRAIVTKHTGGKRWKEADPAVWPAIKDELTAAVAAK